MIGQDLRQIQKPYTFITKVKTKYEALHDTTASLSASKGYYQFETVCKETDAKVIPLKQS